MSRASQQSQLSRFARLFGNGGDDRATADDLQGLLLQVVFALLMVFIVAYFIFVDQEKKHRAEEVMAVNRQKLTLAIDKIAEDRRIRYGLNALMTQGTDGKRTFEPDEHVRNGRIDLAPAAKEAFAAGSRAAWRDYVGEPDLAGTWRREVLAEAKLTDADLDDAERAWLAAALAENVESVRLDVRGVQRSLAARLQRQWVENPSRLGDVTDPRGIASFLKTESLRLVERMIQDGGVGHALP